MVPPIDADQPALIPLVDLCIHHQKIREEILAAIGSVAKSQKFINGPEVEAFEGQMAHRLGIDQAIGVSSGTDAILMTLMALGIGPGDEVITTPFTFVSTAEVIQRVGARPIFADIDPKTLLIDPTQVTKRISSRTRAVIVVHLYGAVCNLPEILSLAKSHKFFIIEDCAQSMGARLNNQSAGTFGAAGTFSFFPSKNLGSWGDAGMVVTQDPELASKLRRIRNHGASSRDHYVQIGGNFRLDSLQAAVLSVKIRHLDKWLEARQQAARTYRRLFSQSGLDSERLVLPEERTNERHAYNLFVIQADRRDQLMQHLQHKGIGTAIYYPTPLHLQPCFHYLQGKPGDLPVAELAAKRVLALPIFPEILPSQQEQVVDGIVDFYRQH